jgi:hypothetical protein
VVLLDTRSGAVDLPMPRLPGQIVAMAPWSPELWGGCAISDLAVMRARGAVVGTLVGLGPTLRREAEIEDAVRATATAGGEFVLAMPMFVPSEDRHRVYDAVAGEHGDEALENLLFHSDLAELAVDLERAATRACRAAGLAEGLPGPATTAVARETFAASAQLLLWARRLDILDGVDSLGWQLRRAAKALLASHQDPRALVCEDNLRVVPGFTPWVEAFARALWGEGGTPFGEALARWVAP